MRLSYWFPFKAVFKAIFPYCSPSFSLTKKKRRGSIGMLSHWLPFKAVFKAIFVPPKRFSCVFSSLFGYKAFLANEPMRSCHMRFSLSSSLETVNPLNNPLEIIRTNPLSNRWKNPLKQVRRSLGKSVSKIAKGCKLRRICTGTWTAPMSSAPPGFPKKAYFP